MDQLPAYPYRAEGWDRQIYPMPSFARLSVADVNESSRWYQEALGFAGVFTLRAHDGRALLAHLRWCTFADLLLTPATAPLAGEKGLGIALNFATPSADDVAERARTAGASIVEGPIDRPWNARDVTIADPDGFRLVFTAPAARAPNEPAPSFDEIMARARDQMRGR